MKEIENLTLDGEEINFTGYVKSGIYADDNNTFALETLKNGNYTLRPEDYAGKIEEYKDLDVTISESVKEYDYLIKENILPDGAKRYGVYAEEDKVGAIIPKKIFKGKLHGQKMYSAIVISDSHIIGTAESDGMIDLERALKYAEDTDVLFTVHCGDVTDGGTEYQFTQYKALKNKYSKPCYAIGGNHDCYSSKTDTYDTYTKYFGNPLYYSFKQDDDVYTMLGESSWTESTPFLDAELQWLYETLEENRNKRCFVFQHILSLDKYDGGNPEMFYKDNDIFGINEKTKSKKNAF